MNLKTMGLAMVMAFALAGGSALAQGRGGGVCDGTGPKGPRGGGGKGGGKGNCVRIQRGGNGSGICDGTGPKGPRGGGGKGRCQGLRNGTGPNPNCPLKK